MLRHSVNEIVAWMTDTKVDADLTEMIQQYLLAQDTKLMAECLADTASPILHTLADVQDRLGWDNFVEGRVSTVFIAAVKPQLSAGRFKRSAEKWCSQLSSKLLSLTHSQWLFRNSHVHFRKLGGLTTKQHEDIFDGVINLMGRDPEELLPKHRYLLQEDFHQLGKGSSGTRQVWIQSMESALKTAALVHSGGQYRGNLGHYVPAVAYNNVIRSDSTGRCVYRRSRRRARV